MGSSRTLSKDTVTDGGYGWVIVFAVFLINFVTTGVEFTFGILLVELLEEFGQGRASTAFVGAILSGVMHLVGNAEFFKCAFVYL